MSSSCVEAFSVGSCGCGRGQQYIMSYLHAGLDFRLDLRGYAKKPKSEPKIGAVCFDTLCYKRSSLCLFYRCIFHDHTRQRQGMKSHRSVALVFILQIHPILVVSFIKERL